MIPLSLFLSLFRTLDWEKLKSQHFIANGCIIALVTAAICALKSDLIPAGIILFTSSYLFYIIGSRMQQKAIYEFLVATLLLVVFFLPWMISMYQSSGTLLYPILGKGYHGSVYGIFLLPSSEITILSAVKVILKALISVDFVICFVLIFIIFGR